MKLKEIAFSRRFLRVLLVITAAAAILAVPVAAADPERIWLTWIMLGAYVLLNTSLIFVSGKKRIPCAILTSLLLFGLGFLILPWQGKIWVLSVPLAESLLTFLFLSPDEYHDEMTTRYCVICLILQLLMQMLVTLSNGFNAVCGAIAVPLPFCFVLFCALWLLSMNRISLVNAGTSGQKPGKYMKRSNKVLLGGFFAALLAVSIIPQLTVWLRAAWEWTKMALAKAMDWIANLLYGNKSGGGGGGGGAGDLLAEFGEMEVHEDTWLDQVLRIIALIFCVAVILTLVYLGGRKVYRILKKLFARMMDRLRKYASDAGGDYTDTEEDMRQTEEQGRESGGKAMLRRLFENENGMTPSQRIRYRFKVRLRKMKEWPVSGTANELLNPAAAEIYEKVRYGEKEATAQDAEHFTEMMKG